jgi:hypothetical protein
VRRSDYRRSARCTGGGLIVDKDRCIAPFDPVVRIEDRRVNDCPEPLAGGVRRIGRNQRVDEDLIPFKHLIGLRLPRRGAQDESQYNQKR